MAGLLCEWLIELARRVELVYSPSTNAKVYHEEVNIALVEGSIANQDYLEIIQQVRDHTKFLLSFGDCAATGNVTALRDPLSQLAEITKSSPQSVLTRAYLEETRHPQLPKSDLVPPLLSQVCLYIK